MALVVLLSTGMLVPSTTMLVPPSQPGMHVAARTFHVHSSSSGLSAPPQLLFPDHFPDHAPSTLLASAAADSATDTMPEEDEGKSRGRLILAAIVCNSIFWQYLYPTLKGEENALGKALGSRGTKQGRK